MVDLNFRVDSAEPQPFAAAPMLRFKLRVTDEGQPAIPVRGMMLRCQIQIEPTRRRYVPAERDRLLDLFDTPDRWSQTLRTLLWTHANVNVPPFTGSIVVDLPVPCTFDFNVAATKYFAALDEGEVPLCLLFSGTIFYDRDDGGVQIAQVPWEKETTYRLPIAVWRAMMDHYYPNSAWLCLHKDVFDRLYQYKSRNGLATWEQALEKLLPTC